MQQQRNGTARLVAWLASAAAACLGGPAWAGCAGSPYDGFDFWLGAWHDPAEPPGVHYTVRRIAGGCAIEEVLVGGDGQTEGIGVAGWNSERNQWQQLWVDANRVVTTYHGGPQPDGTVVLTSEPKDGDLRWRYTYRSITPGGMDADYAFRRGGGDWTTVWSGHFDRIASGSLTARQ